MRLPDRRPVNHQGPRAPLLPAQQADAAPGSLRFAALGVGEEGHQAEPEREPLEPGRGFEHRPCFEGLPAMRAEEVWSLFRSKLKPGTRFTQGTTHLTLYHSSQGW